jgi:hypothetical protein
MDYWDQFAAEAELFAQWAESNMQGGPDGALAALQRIARLYVAGLQLPESDVGDFDEDAFRVSQTEWREVFNRSAILEIDYYNACEPNLDADPEYLVGSLADDIADIYCDVCTGLRMYRAGHRLDAAWHWRFSFQSHWGSHAADAIRVLHRHVTV